MIAYIQTLEEFDNIVCGLISNTILYANIYSITQISKAKENQKVVLVDYTASWCGPCKMISPVLERMAEAADSSRIEFYKVDVDEAVEIAQKAGVTAVCLTSFCFPFVVAEDIFSDANV